VRPETRDSFVVGATAGQFYSTNMGNLPAVRSAGCNFQQACRTVRIAPMLRGAICAQLNQGVIKTFANISRDLASFIRIR
jgi:hypothetical protein